MMNDHDSMMALKNNDCSHSARKRLIVDDLLCIFANHFPILASEILHRDRRKRRNFREETITDVLMAGLIGFEPFGIRVDFPANESQTGEDMDWEFVDPQAPDDRRYLRLHIQAKRAISSNTKNEYWYYKHLDHAVPRGAYKGTQHKLLVDEARASAGCVPLYMFYHPRNALQQKNAGLPAIEGVNVMFADKIPELLLQGSWPRDEKKTERWRPHFMPLSSLLCFEHGATDIGLTSDGQFAFVVFERGGSVSPGELADRLNERRAHDKAIDGVEIQAIGDIPPSTLGALDPDPIKYRADIGRPRVIFHTRRVE